MVKKAIAIFVAVALFSVFSASAFPLHAQEIPGAIEKTGPAAPPRGGSSILPWVLIGVGAVAIALVLILVVFKSYDITGTWLFVLSDGHETESLSLTFSGAKESGTWTVTGAAITLGTYTVDGKNVTMVISSNGETITGSFTDKNSMSGTWGPITGVTWTATRTSATAARATPVNLASLFGK
jgi:hypothetical protein